MCTMFPPSCLIGVLGEPALQTSAGAAQRRRLHAEVVLFPRVRVFEACSEG